MPILLPAIRDLVTGIGLDAIDQAYAARDRAVAHRATATQAVESAERDAKVADRAHRRETVLQLVADKPLPGRPPGVPLDELQADLDDAGHLVDDAVAHVAQVLQDHGPALLTVVAQRRAKLGPDDPDVARLHAAAARWVLLERTPVCVSKFNSRRAWWPLPLAWDGHLSFSMSSAQRGEPHWIEWAWAQLAAGDPKGYKAAGPNRIAFAKQWVNPEPPSRDEKLERMYELIFV